MLRFFADTMHRRGSRGRHCIAATPRWELALLLVATPRGHWRSWQCHYGRYC